MDHGRSTKRVQNERQIYISKTLNEYVLKDLAVLISFYDFNFEGKSYGLGKHDSGIKYLLTLPGNRVISGSNDHTICLWTIGNDYSNDYQPDLRMIGHNDWVRCLGMLPNGRILSTSDDATIKIWNIQNSTIEKKTIEAELTLNGHIGYIRCLDIISDTQIVSGGDDCSVIIWNLCYQDDAIKLDGMITISDHIDWLCRIKVIPNVNLPTDHQPHNTKCQKIISQSFEDTLIVSFLDKDTIFSKTCKYKARSFEILDYDKSLDQSLIACGSNRFIHIWNYVTDIYEAKLDCGNNKEIISCLVSDNQNSRLFSGSDNGVIKMWNLQSKTCEWTVSYFCHSDFDNIIILPDNRLVSISIDDGGYLAIWDLTQPIIKHESNSINLPHQLLNCNNSVGSSVITKDYKIICGTLVGNIVVWY